MTIRITTMQLIEFLQGQCSWHLQRIASERLLERPDQQVIEWHAFRAEHYAQASARLRHWREDLSAWQNDPLGQGSANTPTDQLRTGDTHAQGSEQK